MAHDKAVCIRMLIVDEAEGEKETEEETEETTIHARGIRPINASVGCDSFSSR